MDILQEALKQGLYPSIVVAIYLIVVKLIDSRKENRQIELNNNLIESINKISKFIDSLTKNIIDKDKDKCKTAIEDAMYSAGMRLCNFVSTTVINNHVDVNKENIIANIHNIVNAEFYTVYSTLSLYSVGGTKVCDYLKKEWITDVEHDLTTIIFNEKLGKEDKILSFSNKINIKFQSYITNVINHCL